MAIHWLTTKIQPYLGWNSVAIQQCMTAEETKSKKNNPLGTKARAGVNITMSIKHEQQAELKL